MMAGIRVRRSPLGLADVTRLRRIDRFGKVGVGLAAQRQRGGVLVVAAVGVRATGAVRRGQATRQRA